MNKKTSISLITIIVLTLGIGGYYFSTGKKASVIACTQEAKICPDGSAVSRTGPNCEFALCPTNKNKTVSCKTNSDCLNGASCMTEGPLIANQPVRRVCVPKGQVVPL